MGYVAVTDRRAAATQRELFDGNQAWFTGPDPEAGKVIRWDYMQPAGTRIPTAGCPDGRTIAQEVAQDRISAEVECATNSSLAIRTTYHPNWRVFVDGASVESYMISPGYIGIDLPAGHHRVDAIYMANPSKGPLLALGLALLGLAALLRKRLDRPAAWVARRTGWMPPSDDPPSGPPSDEMQGPAWTTVSTGAAAAAPGPGAAEAPKAAGPSETSP